MLEGYSQHGQIIAGICKRNISATLAGHYSSVGSRAQAGKAPKTYNRVVFYLCFGAISELSITMTERDWEIGAQLTHVYLLEIDSRNY